jgi:hypothetical protein
LRNLARVSKKKLVKSRKIQKKSQFSQQKEAQQLVEKNKNNTFFIPAIFQGGKNQPWTLPSTSANSNTNYIIFRNVEFIFNINFLQKSKNILKDNSEYLGIFHLLK